MRSRDTVGIEIGSQTVEVRNVHITIQFDVTAKIWCGKTVRQRRLRQPFVDVAIVEQSIRIGGRIQIVFRTTGWHINPRKQISLGDHFVNIGHCTCKVPGEITSECGSRCGRY